MYSLDHDIAQSIRTKLTANYHVISIHIWQYLEQIQRKKYIKNRWVDFIDFKFCYMFDG